jgi:hypothetical protein
MQQRDPTSRLQCVQAGGKPSDPNQLLRWKVSRKSLYEALLRAGIYEEVLHGLLKGTPGDHGNTERSKVVRADLAKNRLFLDQCSFEILPKINFRTVLSHSSQMHLSQIRKCVPASGISRCSLGRACPCACIAVRSLARAAVAEPYLLTTI